MLFKDYLTPEETCLPEIITTTNQSTMISETVGYFDLVHPLLLLLRLLTLRRLMSYIYGAPILDVSRSHATTQHSR